MSKTFYVTDTLTYVRVYRVEGAESEDDAINRVADNCDGPGISETRYEQIEATSYEICDGPEG